MRVVYWTCSDADRRKIMDYFQIKGVTLNGESDADHIPADKEEKFLEGVKKGFYTIRIKNK